MKTFLEKFYVATKSGGIYEVEYNKDEVSASAKKIFCLIPVMSKVQAGDELFPGGRFIAITKELGLCKYETKDGKKIDIEKFESSEWEGVFDWTSPIVGLFLEKESASIYCHNSNYYSNNENWYKQKSCQDVLQSIGSNHPVITFSEKLLLSNEIPF